MYAVLIAFLTSLVIVLGNPLPASPATNPDSIDWSVWGFHGDVWDCEPNVCAMEPAADGWMRIYCGGADPSKRGGRQWLLDIPEQSGNCWPRQCWKAFGNLWSDNFCEATTPSRSKRDDGESDREVFENNHLPQPQIPGIPSLEDLPPNVEGPPYGTVNPADYWGVLPGPTVARAEDPKFTPHIPVDSVPDSDEAIDGTPLSAVLPVPTGIGGEFGWLPNTCDIYPCPAPLPPWLPSKTDSAPVPARGPTKLVPRKNLPDNVPDDFWDREDSPASALAETDYLKYEFLHCSSVLKKEESRVTGDCNYLAGSVAKGSEQHLYVRGTKTLIGTCGMTGHLRTWHPDIEWSSNPGVVRVMLNGLCVYDIQDYVFDFLKISN